MRRDAVQQVDGVMVPAGQDVVFRRLQLRTGIAAGTVARSLLILPAAEEGGKGIKSEVPEGIAALTAGTAVAILPIAALAAGPTPGTLTEGVVVITKAG